MKLRNGIPRRQKSAFSTLAIFRFPSRPKRYRSSSGHLQHIREGVIGESTARKWFGKFKKGEYDFNDAPRTGQPSEFDEERLKALLKEDGRQTSRELVEKMNRAHITILNHLHSMGFTENLEA